MATLNLTQVGRVCVTVADTDRAIDFYVDTLGFEKVVDVPMGEAMRWVEVALPGTATTIAHLRLPPSGYSARPEAARRVSASTRATSTRTTPRSRPLVSTSTTRSPAGAAPSRRCSGSATPTGTR